MVMRMVRVWLDAMTVFLIFLGCTLIFYYGILWISGEFEEYNRYDEPQGKAVKVAQLVDQDDTSQSSLNRLYLFLKNGE